MIRIDTLRMHLPAGFEHRATSIARLVARSLAERHLPQDRGLERITLDPLPMAPETSDAEIAGTIVRQIVEAIGGEE